MIRFQSTQCGPTLVLIYWQLDVFLSAAFFCVCVCVLSRTRNISCIDATVCQRQLGYYCDGGCHQPCYHRWSANVEARGWQGVGHITTQHLTREQGEKRESPRWLLAPPLLLQQVSTRAKAMGAVWLFIFWTFSQLNWMFINNKLLVYAVVFVFGKALMIAQSVSLACVFRLGNFSASGPVQCRRKGFRLGGSSQYLLCPHLPPPLTLLGFALSASD